ncbi:MAG: glycerophosphodiester phosphodiesterase [Chloroflexi bacterium]|nr:glycerophosphodiester phosphodiesterase [Chloroflexota bacterium]
MRSPYIRSPGQHPLVVGHRGALALAPENTFAAFRRAIACGVDAIEFDVQRTADGVPIVIHDATLDRTTSGHGPVRETRWREIRELDAGSHLSPDHSGERVPSLEELLAEARGWSVGLVLELKHPWPGDDRPRDDGLVAAACDLVRAGGLLDRTLFISFDHPSIAEMISREPAARTALLTEGPTLVDPLAPARAVPGVLGLHVRWQWISRTVIDAAHAAGLHVHAWGHRHPQDPLVVRRLIGLGVDSLSADAPDALVALVSSR